MMASVIITCTGCKKQFDSKNQLFRHLNQSAKTCLSPEEYRDFLTHVVSTKREKIAVLYGYLPGTDYRFIDAEDSLKDVTLFGIEGGQHAAWMVTQAIDIVSRVDNIDDDDSGSTRKIISSWSTTADPKISRSYGNVSREQESVKQDPHTGAITEVLCTTAVPLFVNETSNDTDKNSSKADTDTDMKIKMSNWVQSVNEQLDKMLAEMAKSHSTSSASTDNKYQKQKWSPGRIRVFGRISITHKRFNPETDCTHRRVDYCFPADLLFTSASKREGLSKTAVQPDKTSLQEFFNSFLSFPPGNKPHSASGGDGSVSHTQYPLNTNRPNDTTLKYLSKMKKIMKKITTQVEVIDDKDAGSILEKEFHDAKRKKKKMKGNKHIASKDDTSSTPTAKNNQGESSTMNTNKPLSSTRVLKRKRYHNFCPSILAHDFLAYRRVDRIYHRATIRLEAEAGSDTSGNSAVSSTTIKNRPFIVFSITGDMFLQEQ